MAVYEVMIHRLLAILLAAEDFEREEHYIVDTLRKNAYSSTTIEMMSGKHTQRLDRTSLHYIANNRHQPHHPTRNRRHLLKRIFKTFNIERTEKVSVR